MDSLYFYILTLIFINNVCECQLNEKSKFSCFQNVIDSFLREETVTETSSNVNFNSSKNLTELYNKCGIDVNKLCIGFPKNCLKNRNCALFLSRRIYVRTPQYQKPTSGEYTWTLFSKARDEIKPSQNYVAFGLSRQEKVDKQISYLGFKDVFRGNLN